ncbi:MAG TPA: hypothetical protein VE035_14455 [Puia sp.]|nr:hypothetical protein [Puia sp.]
MNRSDNRLALLIVLLLVTGNLLITGHSMAQTNSIAHFSIWKPKAGLEQNFEAGYKQHLKWHKSAGDKWSWYGWYFISGPRDGQFVDGTFDHAWSDLDHSVKPAEDGADNNLHTYPFGDFREGFNVKYLASLSISDSTSLRSKFLRLVTVHVSDVEKGKTVLEKLKALYQSKAGIRTFLTYKMIDGGNLNQFFLLIGLNSFEEYGRSENLQEELLSIERSLNLRAVESISSETLAYRADMSLLAD